MMTLEEARERMLQQIAPLGVEQVALAQCAGRVLAEDFTARIDLPPFDNSAMDGYALRAEDVRSATPENPATLNQIGETPAGGTFSEMVEAGQCVRVFTGSPLPAGADAVVMQEDTRADGQVIHVLDATKPWENIRLRGEDIRSGGKILCAGNRLGAGHLGLLASQGTGSITAFGSPLVGVIATGNELREAGAPLTGGEIYESNRVMLSALLRNDGLRATVFPIVADTMDATCAALRLAFAQCDAVITAGGASVGTHDLVKQAFESLGGHLHFWKVAIKPGKPFLFGQLAGKSLFGLPGNPVSALVTHLMLVRPALMRMQGATELLLPTHPAVLGEPLGNRGDRCHFMRVWVDHQGAVKPSGMQASHALGALAQANGLVDVPPHTTWPAGTPVAVHRWQI